MNFDTDQNDSLVAPDNQLNSNINLPINSSNNSKLNNSDSNSLINTDDITSKLSNSIKNDNQNDKSINDNQINVLIDSEFNVSINELDNKLNKSNDNLNSENNQFNDNENNQVNENDNNQVNENENIQFNNDNLNEIAIEKLGLNLDYKPTDLSELEKSTTSILSSLNRSETNSKSNSRSNSPSRISQTSLTLPPKRIASEINLLTNEIYTKSNDDQLNFYRIERKNLMHLASLILNNLINNISPLTKDLECHNNIVLYDFFSITEQCLKHGLKVRKGLIFGKKELWNLFESIENANPQINEIMQNIRELPDVKTNSGRVKSFLRLAFVHKEFNEIINYLINCKELLRNFYETGSFIMSDEIEEFLNKTAVLKEFDFRWCPKDDRPKLDELSNLINLTNYLIDKNRPTKEIIYKVNINKEQLKDLIEEKQFYETKAKEFRNKILFYYNRIKELDIECLFENELIKNPSKFDLLTKKMNEFFKQHTSITSNEIKSDHPDIQSLQEDISTLKKQLEIELSNRVSKDAALEYIESDILIKNDENIVMRHQIEEVKQVNEELCIKVGELGQTNNDLNNKITLLKTKNQQLVQNVGELQKNLVTVEAKYNKLSTTERLLRKQFDELNELNLQLQKQLQKEQEDKNNLQKKLDDHVERNSTVLTELNQANNLSKDYPALKKKYDILTRRCKEYELTMEELGVRTQLQSAKLEIENLKEQNLSIDAVWKNEKEVSACERCDTQFSTLIRKHHCRNCGGVYCSKCSDNKIPLPSSDKPMRVCDNCHVKLLQRYSAK